MKPYSLACLWLVVCLLPFVLGPAYAMKESDLVFFDHYWLKKSDVKASGAVCETCGNTPKTLTNLFICSKGAEYHCKKCLKKNGQTDFQDRLLCPSCKEQVQFTPWNLQPKKTEQDSGDESEEPEFYAYCNNELCKWSMRVLDDSFQEVWEKHQEECQYLPYKNCYLCGRRHYIRDTEKHLKIICPKREVVCEICGSPYRFDEEKDHEFECQVNVLRRAVNAIVEFKTDAEYRMFAIKIINNIGVFHEDVKNIENAVKTEFYKQSERLLALAADPDIGNAHHFNIEARGIEDDVKFNRYFTGFSNNFNFYESDSNSKTNQQLLVVVYPVSENKNLIDGSRFSELYTASIWLLDKSGRKEQWKGRISEDVTVTFIFPNQNKNTLFKKIIAKPDVFDLPMGVSHLPREKTPTYPAYKLGVLARETRLENITAWLHPGPTGSTRFKIALSPRVPTQHPQYVRRHLPLMLPEITKTLMPLVQTSEKTLRLTLPARLFRRFFLSEEDRKIYGEQGGFYFKVGEEIWNIYIGFIKGPPALSFKLKSGEYKNNLKVIHHAFGSLKNNQSFVWPESLDLYSESQSDKHFINLVNTAGYNLDWPTSLFATAVDGDYVVIDLDLEMDAGITAKGGLSVIKHGGDSAKREGQTLYERIRFLEISELDSRAREKEREREIYREQEKDKAVINQLENQNRYLSEQVIPVLKQQILELQLGGKYGNNNIIGGFASQGDSLIEWKVSQLKGYNHNYHFSSPEFDIGGVLYQVEIKPNPANFNQLKVYFKAISSRDGGDAPWFRPLRKYEFEFYHYTTREWRIIRVDLDNLARVPLFRNPVWKDMKSSNGRYVIDITREYFSPQDGLNIKIKLYQKGRGEQPRQAVVNEQSPLLQDD